MKNRARMFSAYLLLACATAAHAELQFDTTFAVFADDEDGSSLDIDASLSPNDRWTFSLGAGQSESSSESENLNGTALRGAVDLHNERFGIRGYYERWSDPDRFETDAFGARLSYITGGVTLTLIGESKSHDLEFDTLTGPARRLRNNSQFDAIGYGAGASWYGSSWGAYAEGILYDFDEALDRLIRITNAPNADRVPKVAELVNSIVTATQGALDSQLSAGIERTFNRSTVRFDWLNVEDALDGVKSNSYSSSLRYEFTQSLDGEVTLGISDTENLGSIGFAGLTFSYHR